MDEVVTEPAAPVVKRKRGRPPATEEAIEQRRREIIEAAHAVFSERGYHAAGIADIAERLGIGHGTFYRYFENKRDILDHVIDFGVERFLDVAFGETPEAATTLEEFTDQLAGAFERLFDELDREPDVARIVLLEATSIDEELTQRILGLVETLSAVSVPALRNGVERGFLRADLDVDAIGRAITGIVVAGLFAAVRGTFGPAERRRYVDAVTALISAGAAASDN
jgi:AcrR family transcriptional regulator